MMTGIAAPSTMVGVYCHCLTAASAGISSSRDGELIAAAAQSKRIAPAGIQDEHLDAGAVPVIRSRTRDAEYDA